MTFVIVKRRHEFVEVLQIQVIRNFLFNTFNNLPTIGGRYLGKKF